MLVDNQERERDLMVTAASSRLSSDFELYKATEREEDNLGRHGDFSHSQARKQRDVSSP